MVRVVIIKREKTVYVRFRDSKSKNHESTGKVYKSSRDDRTI